MQPSKRAAVRAPATLVTLPRDMIFFILKKLDRRSLLKVSASCSRIRDVARDPALWPEFPLGPRSTDDAIKVVTRIYSPNKRALTRVRAKDSAITAKFFTELVKFLGKDNEIQEIAVKGCKGIGTLDLTFPNAKSISLKGTSSLYRRFFFSSRTQRCRCAQCVQHIEGCCRLWAQV